MALLLATWVEILADAAHALPITFTTSDYDNTFNTVTAGATTVNNQKTGLFRDVLWWSINNNIPRIGSADYINQGNSLVSSGGSPAHAVPGSGPYTALNFTGPSTSAGQSYISVYDTTPADGVATRNLFDASRPGGLKLSADVLFTPGQHSTSGGLVALYSDGQDALALLASNGGGNNLDVPKLTLVSRSVGKGITVKSVNLPGLTSFVADTWYRVTMDVTVSGGSFLVNGSFNAHQTPTNPNSPLGRLITTLTFSGFLSDPDLVATAHNSLVLTNPGEIGVIAMSNQVISDGGCPPPFTVNCNDSVGVSITNFDFVTSGPEPVTAVPEPSAVLLLGTGLIALGYAARRRLAFRQTRG